MFKTFSISNCFLIPLIFLKGVLQNVHFVFGTTLDAILRNKGCQSGGESLKKKNDEKDWKKYLIVSL